MRFSARGPLVFVVFFFHFLSLWSISLSFRSKNFLWTVNDVKRLLFFSLNLEWIYAIRENFLHILQISFYFRFLYKRRKKNNKTKKNKTKIKRKERSYYIFFKVVNSRGAKMHFCFWVSFLFFFDTRGENKKKSILTFTNYKTILIEKLWSP